MRLTALLLAALVRVRARRVPPIPCREDLAMAAEVYFKQTGEAAEVGVYRGFFSKHNLRDWTGSYTMIDFWNARPNETIDNFMSPADMRIAEANVAPYRHRVSLVQALSLEAATRYAHAHFDWLYIDALHTYEAVLADLRAWWPKLRKGGLMSGDDYGDDRDTPFVSARRWAEYYGKVAQLSHWGTIRAVQAFADEVDRQLFVTWMCALAHTHTRARARARTPME